MCVIFEVAGCRAPFGNLMQAYARSHAQREHISIGEAISRLARDGIRAQNMPVTKIAKPKSKFALLPARNEIITTAHVRQLMDQEGI